MDFLTIIPQHVGCCNAATRTMASVVDERLDVAKINRTKSANHTRARFIFVLMLMCIIVWLQFEH